MNFTDLYSQKDVVYSLEFFPPKNPENLSKTLSLVERLSKVQPDYMTVTYGAGGSTRGLTKEITKYIAEELHIPAVAHLTCVDHSSAEIDEILNDLQSASINNVLALRGDPPKGVSRFTPHTNGFSCARDLTAHIESRGDYSIAVAGYPEVHPEAKSPEQELQYLKEKVDAGGEIVVTQLFFDCDAYFRFVENARRTGITVPIVPGVLPVSNLTQLNRIVSMCGASLPKDLAQNLEAIEAHESPEGKAALRAYGTEYALTMCQKLIKGGAPGVHFYTLNKSRQVEDILGALRLDPMGKLSS